MKQEDKQYEKWLTEVKSNQPILENPEELTATILNRISGISPERKRRKFLIGAWASGIAASLLLLLFINDTCFTSVPHRTEMQNEYDNWSNSIPLPDNWEEMRLLEKNTYLSSQYTQHRKSRKMQILHFLIGIDQPRLTDQIFRIPPFSEVTKEIIAVLAGISETKCLDRLL